MTVRKHVIEVLICRDKTVYQSLRVKITVLLTFLGKILLLRILIFRSLYGILGLLNSSGFLTLQNKYMVINLSLTCELNAKFLKKNYLKITRYIPINSYKPMLRCVCFFEVCQGNIFVSNNCVSGSIVTSRGTVIKF